MYLTSHHTYDDNNNTQKEQAASQQTTCHNTTVATTFLLERCPGLKSRMDRMENFKKKKVISSPSYTFFLHLFYMKKFNLKDLINFKIRI